MPDEIFANPRLAVLYDHMESDRADLDHYLAMVDEFGARSVLDVGCGTGVLACLLAARGIEVVGVDPAAASLEVARRKSGADAVRWIHGDTSTLPALTVELATMTGNVAQVFVTDADWSANLAGIHSALRPGGRLIFEVRDPATRDWEHWTRDESLCRVEVPGIGSFENWVELTDVSLPYVSFRYTFRFDDGAVVTSDSTLRFREFDEIIASLTDAGFVVQEVRDAPDRLGLEFVFIAQVPDP